MIRIAVKCLGQGGKRPFKRPTLQRPPITNEPSAMQRYSMFSLMGFNPDTRMLTDENAAIKVTPEVKLNQIKTL